MSNCVDRDRAVDASEVIFVEPRGRSEALPLSLNHSFAMLGDSTACVIDSYEVRLICGNLKWTVTNTVGREGKGPGEISHIGQLVSGPGRAVSFVDYGNARISVFGPEGYVRAIRRSVPLIPAGDWNQRGRLAGYTISTPSAAPALRMYWIDLEGAVVSDQTLRFDPTLLDTTHAILTGAMESPSESLVVRVEAGSQKRLAIYSPDGGFAQLLDWPPFLEAYPTERDVEEWLEQSRRLFARAPGGIDLDVEAYKHRPLGRLPRVSVSRTVQYDAAGRLWVLTTASSSSSTQLDVFRASRYIGSASLLGRVLGIQIRDTLLIALSEDSHSDQNGAYSRYLYTYALR